MATLARIVRHERSARPLGSEGLVTRLEALLGHILHRRKPCPRGPHLRRRRGRNWVR